MLLDCSLRFVLLAVVLLSCLFFACQVFGVVRGVCLSALKCDMEGLGRNAEHLYIRSWEMPHRSGWIDGRALTFALRALDLVITAIRANLPECARCAFIACAHGVSPTSISSLRCVADLRDAVHICSSRAVDLSSTAIPSVDCRRSRVPPPRWTPWPRRTLA